MLRTTDDAGDEGELSIDVWAQVVDDVGFAQRNPHFGVLALGETGTLPLILVARVPGMRVRLEDVRLEGPAASHLTVTFQPEVGAYLDDDGSCQRWEVRVVADGALPAGAFEAELIALLDDDQHPQARTTLRGMVR